MVIGLLNLSGHTIFDLFEVYLAFELLLHIEVCIAEGHLHVTRLMPPKTCLYINYCQFKYLKIFYTYM